MPMISVNNATLDIPEQANLSEIIVLSGFENQSIAIALNGEFIPKANYSSTQLNANDTVDIVKPIGGG